MSDPETPPETKLTRTKRLWAEAGKFLVGRRSRPEDERLPPGQHLVKDWPVLDLGIVPAVPLARFRLDVDGLVRNRLSLDWGAFQALRQTTLRSDIHCVTSWSRYDNDWTGVRTRELMARADPVPEAGHVILHGHDSYTTNLPIADFVTADSILATHWQGEPLAREHGGPLRAVVPHLYFWKSAKWLKRIEVIGTDRAGYWERNGYHMYGDPWSEQRYG